MIRVDYVSDKFDNNVVFIDGNMFVFAFNLVCGIESKYNSLYMYKIYIKVKNKKVSLLRNKQML